MRVAQLGKRLLLLGASSTVVVTLLFGVDRLLERHYYGQTYRYYETAEVYHEDENTLLLFSPSRHLFWAIKPNIVLAIEEDPTEYHLEAPAGRPGHYTFEVRSNSGGLNSPEISLEKPPNTVRIVTLGDKEHTMAVLNESTVRIEMTLVQSIFNFLSDPNVATILFAIGALGLYMEFQSPGLIVPGVTGVVAMVLFGFALQILPFSWIGVLLILLGVGLLVAELFITSLGLLFAAGLACFLIGGTMVFDRPELSDLTVSFWEVLIPIAAAMSVLGAFVVYSLSRTFMSHQTAGVDEMIGLVGRCEAAIDPEGKVFVRGEYWNSVSDERIAAGDPVEVLEIQGLTLVVRPTQNTH